MKIPEIKKDLRKKLRNTINEVANRSEEIMHDEIEGFYAGGTPVYYKRTGTLRSAPQITDKYCNSKEAGVTASLDQTISYSTGFFSGAQVIDAAEHGTSGIVGRGGFWARSENRIKDAVDEAVSNNF